MRFNEYQKPSINISCNLKCAELMIPGLFLMHVPLNLCAKWLALALITPHQSPCVHRGKRNCRATGAFDRERTETSPLRGLKDKVCDSVISHGREGTHSQMLTSTFIFTSYVINFSRYSVTVNALQNHLLSYCYGIFIMYCLFKESFLNSDGYQNKHGRKS